MFSVLGFRALGLRVWGLGFGAWSLRFQVVESLGLGLDYFLPLRDPLLL